MRIGLLIAEFESTYSTSFQPTARVKYGLNFDTSNIGSLGAKLAELKRMVEAKEGKNVHVGFEITLDHVEYLFRCSIRFWTGIKRHFMCCQQIERFIQ